LFISSDRPFKMIEYLAFLLDTRFSVFYFILIQELRSGTHK
jgi:hypothetical protein